MLDFVLNACATRLSSTDGGITLLCYLEAIASGALLCLFGMTVANKNALISNPNYAMNTKENTGPPVAGTAIAYLLLASIAASYVLAIWN